MTGGLEFSRVLSRSPGRKRAGRQGPPRGAHLQVAPAGGAGTSCFAAWAQIALNERGEVMYCCHKPYQVVGHILDEDILEKKAATLTDMRTCDIPCRLTAPNSFIAQTMADKKDACFI